AIRGRHAHERTARAELRSDMTCHLTAQVALQRDRYTEVEAAIDGARLEVRGIVLRNRETYAAVRRAERQARAKPAIAAQLCRDPAIHRRPLHVARYIR